MAANRMIVALGPNIAQENPRQVPSRVCCWSFLITPCARQTLAMGDEVIMYPYIHPMI